MDDMKSGSLFNKIAPIYNLFYPMQKRNFRRIIKNAQQELDLSAYTSILDVGCGTGALCSVLHEQGLQVTGLDPAGRMLQFAKQRPENKDISFLQGNALERLPFEDKSFDVCIASYVAHGMPHEDRRRMYSQMGRVAKKLVIIYDYNASRSLLTTAIEWLERGDYFRFIKEAKKEMENCMTDMKACFSSVRVINVDTRAAWYICTPSR